MTAPAKSSTAKTLAIVFLIVGPLLLLIGIIAGSLSIQRQGADCGSAFSANASAPVTADYANAFRADGNGTIDTSLSGVQDSCASALSDRKLLTWGPIIPGAIITFCGLIALLAANNGQIGSQTAPQSTVTGTS